MKHFPASPFRRPLMPFLVAFVLAPATTAAQPAGFLQETVVTGLDDPTGFTFAPDGRMFITQQGGSLVVWDGQALTTVLSLTVENYFEQGLLGVALDPAFPDSSFVYLFYTTFSGNQNDNINRVSRFSMAGDIVDPASEEILIEGMVTLSIHTGGDLSFGPDGSLYISTGDGGGPSSRPQDRARLEGKILRIWPDGTIPLDNPFVGVPGVREEVFQLGLRNPYRFTLRPGTDTLFISDAGWNQWEEINTGDPGANFGWRSCEGPCVPPDPEFTDPFHTYDHSAGGASIVGIAFYDGTVYPPNYQGDLFFLDYARSQMGRLDLNGNQILSIEFPFMATPSSPVHLEMGPDGALYYSTYGGTIYRLVHVGSANLPPAAVATADPLEGMAPLSVQFNGTGSSDPEGAPLTYLWDFGDGSQGAGAAPSHVYAVRDTYQVVLTVFDPPGATDTDTLEITLVNADPIATIDEPTTPTLFQPDSVVNFSGSALDVEDGPLPAIGLRWDVELHHQGHVHLLLEDFSGASGSFQASSHDGNFEAGFIRIHLTATDSEGGSGTTFVDIFPSTSPQIVERTYQVAGDEWDAVSIQDEVRVGGYSLSQPWIYVTTNVDQALGAMTFAVDVPPGAEVLQAELVVQAALSQRASATGGMHVRTYDMDDTPPFLDATPQSLEQLHPLAPAFVTWPGPSNWVVGSDVVSPSVVDLLQAFVDRPGYTVGNHVGFVVTSGTMEVGKFYSWEDFASGQVPARLDVTYRIGGAPIENMAPQAVATASPMAGAPPLQVQFDASGSFDPEGGALTYLWDFGDGSDLSIEANPLHTYTSGGTFGAVVTVLDSIGASDTSDSVLITVSNMAPEATITKPLPGETFIVGDWIQFIGNGSDAEDGPLPDSAFEWTVNLHHLEHTHPVVPGQPGKTGAFQTSSHGENLQDIFYRIHLLCTDSSGAVDSAQVDVFPDLSQQHTVDRTYYLAANDRDALSVQDTVRISGYSPGQPFIFVTSNVDRGTAALSFPLDIPPGAQITQAELIVRAADSQNASSSGGMTVRVYDVDDTPPFVDGTPVDLDELFPLSPVSVSWPSPVDWVPDQDVLSSDLSILIQWFIDRPTYQPGSHVTVVVTEGDIVLGRFYSWNDFVEGITPSRLHVVYDVQGNVTPAPPAVGATRLLSVAPNPFRGTTAVQLALPRSQDLSLVVYDTAGRRVRTLARGTHGPGPVRFVWNGRTEDGAGAAAGVYFLRLRTPDAVETGRVVLTR